MKLFLSLNKKKVKGNLSPPTKCKIIQCHTLNNNSPSQRQSTQTIFKNNLYPLSTSPFKPDKTFIKQLKFNKDLVFKKINKIDTNYTINEDEEKLITTSLKETIKLLPNGKYLIQPSKIMSIKFEEKVHDNHSNVKTETTKQSEQTTSSMTGSSSTNTVVGLKRIVLPYKTKLSHSESKREMVRQTIQRESIKYSPPPQRNKKQLSPKYASNAFNTFYGSHSTNNINVNNNHKGIFTNTNQSKFTSGKNSTINIFKNNKSGTQIRIMSYYSKCLTQKGNS